MLPASGTIYLIYLTQIETFLCKQTHMRRMYGRIIDISTFELIGLTESLCSQPGLGRSPGEGYDNPLQYSCLENPMGRGTWRVTVHEIANLMTEQLSICHPRDLSVSLTYLGQSAYLPKQIYPHPNCMYLCLKKISLPSVRHQYLKMLTRNLKLSFLLSLYWITGFDITPVTLILIPAHRFGRKKT